MSGPGALSALRHEDGAASLRRRPSGATEAQADTGTIATKGHAAAARASEATARALQFAAPRPPAPPSNGATSQLHTSVRQRSGCRTSRMQRGSGGGLVGGVSALGGGARCLLHPGLEGVDLHATDATLRRRAAEVRRTVLEVSQPPFQATFYGESRAFKDDTAHVERSVGLQSDINAAGEPISTQRLEPSVSGGPCRNLRA